MNDSLSNIVVNHKTNDPQINNKYNTLYSNTNKSTQNSYEFLISFLNEDKTKTNNSFQIISPNKINIILEPSECPKQEYFFSFNFSQMIILELMRKLPLTQLEYFIKMIININYHKKTVELKYKSLDSIRDMIIRRIKLGNIIFENNNNNTNVFEDNVAGCNSMIIIK